MKDRNRSLDNDAAPGIVGPIEIPGGASWRRIPVAPDAGRAHGDTKRARGPAPERRIDTGTERSVAARFTTIDPVRDPSTGALVYETSEEETVLNVSRRGMCLRCDRPPAVGTRLLLELTLPEEANRADMVGRVCWTRVEYEPGQHGARAIAIVGIELLGGSAAGLDIYDRTVSCLLQSPQSTVATQEAVG